MNTIWHTVKLAAAVLCGVAALVCLFFNMAYVVPLSAVSITFSLMPE